MDIVLHAGAHCTDEDRLVKCLLKNKELLLGRGTSVPGPSRYRRKLRDAVQAAAQSAPDADSREVLLGDILQDDGVTRMLLSNDNFFGVPRIAVADGAIYPRAEARLADLRALFPGDRLTLALGLRNPATFLPALHAEAPEGSFDDFLAGTDPATLHWSELVERLRGAHPGVELILWCNEDTPFIWAEIVRALGDLPEGSKITGGFDLLSEIMSREGMRRFRSYMADHPVMTDRQKRRVIAAFLDKFALPDAVEEELDLPGWDAAYVETLTARYDQDIALIASRPDVRFLSA